MSTSYPNAYCVKCGTHTETQKKHTVILQNNARALRGVCAACASDVYKILPKQKAEKVEAKDARRYPDAYCVKCHAHTPTNNARTVILENASRAVTGSCGSCGSDVYRILGPKEEVIAPPSVMAAKEPVESEIPEPSPQPIKLKLQKTVKASPTFRAGNIHRRLVLTRPAEVKPKAHAGLLIAAFTVALMIAGMMTFLFYAARA